MVYISFYHILHYSICQHNVPKPSLLVIDANKGHFAGIQMIFSAALSAPHANYYGPVHGGMPNGAGVIVKADPFCRNSKCRIEVQAALFCI